MDCHIMQLRPLYCSEPQGGSTAIVVTSLTLFNSMSAQGDLTAGGAVFSRTARLDKTAFKTQLFSVNAIPNKQPHQICISYLKCL